MIDSEREIEAGRRRRFDSIDFSIVGSVGCSVAIALLMTIDAFEAHFRAVSVLIEWTEHVEVALGTTWLGLAVGLLACRLRRPRPNQAAWSGLPGTAAVVAIIASAAMAIVAETASQLGDHLSSSMPISIIVMNFLRAIAVPRAMARTVCCVWVVMALAGPWKRPVDWVEVAGIVLGIACSAVSIGWMIVGHHLDRG